MTIFAIFANMKILHTADWHLGKKLHSFSRLDEQRAVLAEICELADTHDVDAVIIAGDLFDTFNPSAESEELFYQTCKTLSNNGLRAVIAIAGNHDLPERIDAPDPLARACGIVLAGLPDAQITPFSLPTGLALTRSAKGFIELKLPRCTYPLRLLLTPYANETRLRKVLNIEKADDELRQFLAEKWAQTLENQSNTEPALMGVNILVAHLFFMQKNGTPPEEPDDERPIQTVGGATAIFSDNIPPSVQYVALGHLHRPQTIDVQPCPIVYSGSPLAYSFSEENQTKSVVIIEVKPAQAVDYQRVELKSGKKLLRKTAENIADALDWLAENQNALVELTVKTDHYLRADALRLLHQAHAGIISILPFLTGQSDENNKLNRFADLNATREELFIQYFKSVKNKEPNEQLLTLFKEILSVEIEK